MIARIGKCTLQGKVEAPPSKSMAHRFLICGGLAGESMIENISLSEDISATMGCLSHFGVDVSFFENVARIAQKTNKNDDAVCAFDCKESGSTLRFFIPLALAAGKKAIFSGAGRLMERPLTVYENLAKEKGFSFVRENGLLHIDGKLSGGVYRVDGSVSSQFITGLLFALPLLLEESVVEIIPPFESRSYVLLTLQAMEKFGVRVDFDGEYKFFIPKNQTYRPQKIRVEGDWSNAAFLDVFNYLGGAVTVEGLDENSLQGDKIYREYFAALENGRPTLDISDCPDLGPVLMALAAAKNGAVLIGTSRLAVKESDRGRVMAEELSKLGARIRVKENSIEIDKAPLFPSDAPLCGHNDHRIVMSLTTVLTAVGGGISGVEAVKKSFPDYFEKLNQLKAKVNLCDC